MSHLYRVWQRASPHGMKISPPSKNTSSISGTSLENMVLTRAIHHVHLGIHIRLDRQPFFWMIGQVLEGCVGGGGGRGGPVPEVQSMMIERLLSGYGCLSLPILGYSSGSTVVSIGRSSTPQTHPLHHLQPFPQNSGTESTNPPRPFYRLKHSNIRKHHMHK